ncbi:hypothetical protein C5F48_19205 [Cereibacter changlensis JA139]|uniref:Uncharacterized protein n=2 Tax=Cereibacter changlensis TaxID=402884 RepID=A0A2T4JQD3_9RHOB|nr:hypothetical protein [Cereibacter changlensis]PTE20124.1 hypothetical protein C5F48_19205 [Cereibacter changlensis JA139]PZX52811.1 hypothetical protein LX76_02441 [Cereibacter changlensis]
MTTTTITTFEAFREARESRHAIDVALRNFVLALNDDEAADMLMMLNHHPSARVRGAVDAFLRECEEAA